jgi:hypothetical protein
MSTKRRRSVITVAAAGLAGVLIGAAGLAVAQPANAPRAQGQYTMVGARSQGTAAKAIYIIDSQNREMIAVRWNQGQNRLDGLGYRNLAVDADAQGRSR